MRPWRSSVSSTIAATSVSDATSARMPPSGGFRSATTTFAPSASRPAAIAAPIPCAPPVTIATFPSSALTASGENAVGTRIRFCWVWKSGCTFARNSFQRGSAWSRARRSSRSANES